MERLLGPFYDPSLSYEDNEASGPFGLLATDFVYQDQGQPTYQFFDHQVYLPLIIAAGPILNGRFGKRAFEVGWDIVTYKTVRSAFHRSHTAPNLTRTYVPGGVLSDEQRDLGVFAVLESDGRLNTANTFGVPSFHPAIWQPDLARLVATARKIPGKVVIASVQGTPKGDGNIQAFVDDCVNVGLLAEAAGATIIEKNTSCPNEGSKHVLCSDVNTTERVAEAMRTKLSQNTKLLMKIGNFSDDDYLRRFVRQVGPFVDGFTAINTIATKILDENGQQYFPGEGRLYSGAGGDAVRPYGLSMVRRLAGARDEAGLTFKIIGVGGVHIPDDYLNYRRVRADAVGSASGAIWCTDLAARLKQQQIEKSLTFLKNFDLL